MPSPFPGMNPYLENPAVWQDFHHAVLVPLRDALKRQVGGNYYVKLEEMLFIHELPEDEVRRFGRGDVVVSRPLVAPGVLAHAATAAPVPAWLPTLPDVEHHAYLEIVERTNNEVVTVVELLSPANKRPGPDRELYLSKRRHIQQSSVHLVEIDLLRGGPRMPMREAPASDYCIMVSRWETRPQVDVWPFNLRDPIPQIPVPLLAEHGSVSLDIQAALHQIYDGAGYGDFIYTLDPMPALKPEDLAWAQSILA